MPKHQNIIWPVREIGKYPNFYVETEPTGYLKITAAAGVGQMNSGFRITRRHARLLAKRINQCLDGTK